VIITEEWRSMLTASNVGSDQLVVNSLGFDINHFVEVKFFKIRIFGFNVDIELQLLVVRMAL
jgi:hypothetical protein